MIVSSEDGRHIAWSEDGGVMHVTDLEKGDTYDVNAESGQTLKPLGFIGSDCIYGWGLYVRCVQHGYADQYAGTESGIDHGFWRQ